MTTSKVLGNLARGSGFRAAQSSTGKALGEGGVGVTRQHAGRGASRRAQRSGPQMRLQRESQAAVEPGAPAKEAQAAQQVPRGRCRPLAPVPDQAQNPKGPFHSPSPAVR